MRRSLATLTAMTFGALVAIAPVTLAAAATPDPTSSPDATATPSPTSSPDATATPAPTRPALPAPPLIPHPNIPKTSAIWVNHTLRIVYSYAGPFHEGSSESFTEVEVDGKVVGTLEDARARDAVVTVPRGASAGPALVRMVGVDQIERGSYYDVYRTTFSSRTVTRHVVTAKKGQVSAATLLGRLKIASAIHTRSYKASEFPLWVDANRDGENTRAEVLRAESETRVTENGRHAVVSGRWRSAYDGRVVTAGVKLDVTHLVPMKEAWASGASSWSLSKRTAFANDLGYGPSLMAVTKREDRLRGDKQPNAFLPATTGYRCAYVRNYIAVKYRWGLHVDPAEHRALQTDLAMYCVDPFVAKPSAPHVAALVGTSRAKSTDSGSSGHGRSSSAATRGVDVRYGTCTELLRHANHAPYHRGTDPEYAWYQDRDGDGLDCE